MNFKKALALALVLACIFTMLAGCGGAKNDDPLPTDDESNDVYHEEDKPVEEEEDPDDDEAEVIITPDVSLKNLGEDLSATGISDGKFEGDTTNADITVTYISGTKGAYTFDEATKTLSFTTLSADSAYAISGKLNGSIAIDVGQNTAFALTLQGFRFAPQAQARYW